LDDLISVTQNGNNSANARLRSFQYDSLARLTSATNPESGKIMYSYDANSNLMARIAPEANQTSTSKNTTTNYSYDVLNRLTEKTYLSPNSGKDLYAYDAAGLMGCTGPVPPSIKNPTNLVGRRTAMCYAKSSSSWSYDSMGRPLVDARVNVGSSAIQGNIGYSYNKDGSLNTLAYPSGNIVTYTVGAAGRVLEVSDSSNNYVGSSLAPNFNPNATYAPNGALVAMGSGASGISVGIRTNNIYNTRFQPILLSAFVNNQPFFSVCYDFHSGAAISSPPCTFSASTTGDNGNVFQIYDNVNPANNAVYKYDPLNRVSQASTIATTGNCWGEVYAIDAWGNLTGRTQPSGMSGCSYEPLSASVGTNNQLSTLVYDAAGNVTNDGLGNQPTYDTENRIATDAGVTYQYDADGVRTHKSSGTLYWTGLGGQVLTETNLSGLVLEEYVYFNGQRIARVDNPLPITAVHYYFSDHLGSSSVVTDTSGNVQEQYYFYPYGGLFSSTGSDPNHYKFTGKERDSESGLDNFGARYNASTTGRFMTPDPKMPSVRHLLNPEKWNKYAYVLNNPLALVDPDGKEEMTFVYRTFIAPQSINFMGNTYAGDNRGFSTASNASSRSTITVRIETDPNIRPGNPIISQTSSAGESNELDANGNTTKSATATTGLPVATGTRDANGDAVINITQDVKNPLSPVPQFMTPGIGANLNVTATPNGSTVSATGTASTFPSEELNVTGANGTTTPVFQFTPAPGSTPLSLFRPDRDVNATAHPCPSGQSGCSQ
jgi:RHS repeat-associated protein